MELKNSFGKCIFFLGSYPNILRVMSDARDKIEERIADVTKL